MYIIKEFEDRYNEDVNNFIISVFVEEFGFEKCREELMMQNNRDYINEGGNLWIAFDEQKQIIGTIALVKKNEKDVELKKLYVRKDYRGKGLSKELYNTALEKSKKNKFNRIFLGTYDRLETAVNFYIKRGFTEIKDLYNVEDEARYFELYI